MVPNLQSPWEVLLLSASLSVPLSLSLSSFPRLTMHREKEDVHLWECPLNVQALVVLNFRLSCKKSDYPTGQLASGVNTLSGHLWPWEWRSVG